MAKPERDTGRSNGTYISPETAVGSSSLQNVFGFIQDYIPQSYYAAGPLHKEPTILWAKFESIEHNDINSFIKNDPSSSPPLLLFTCYTSGFTLWMITPNNDARELYSSLNDSSEGTPKLVTLLPSPLTDKRDSFTSHRPLMAVVRKGSGSYRPAYSTVLFVSLKGEGVVRRVEFERNSVIDVQCNRRVIVIILQKRLVLLDAGTLEKKWIVKTGHQNSELWNNPVAMGTRWLAISDLKLHAHLLSVGGVNEEASPPVASAVVSTVKKGLSALSGTLSGITGLQGTGTYPTRTTVTCNEGSPPVVTIVDLDHPHTGEVSVEELRKCDGVIAHFLAHSSTDTHITMMKFNHCGDILFSADSEGQCFNIFHISASGCGQGSVQSKVTHLYSLYRGSTTGIVQDVIFSTDSRWVAVSTRNNTTHIFPISSYGGPITVRTHRYCRVVNQLSRYHTSAGIDLSEDKKSPLIISPLQQIKQPHLPSSLKSGGSSNSSTDESISTANSNTDHSVCLRAMFALPFEHNNNSLKNIDFTERRVEYSLYVLGGTGTLTEHILEPVIGTSQSNDHLHTNSTNIVTDTTDEGGASVELQCTPKLSWKLLSKPIENDFSLFDGDSSPFSPSSSTNKTNGEEWLSQVELLTYAPPTRRLWMGPQFTFKAISKREEDGEGEEEREGEWEGVGSPRAVLPTSHDYILDSMRSNTVAMTIGGRQRGREEERLMDSNSLDEGVEVFGSWNDVEPRLKGDNPDLELLIHDAMVDQSSAAPVGSSKGGPYNSFNSLSSRPGVF